MYNYFNGNLSGATCYQLLHIYMVLIALAITVRDDSQISMNFLINMLPSDKIYYIRQFWKIIIILIGLFIVVYGFKVAWTNPGRLFQLGYLPKKYIILILPISGILIIISAVSAIIDDAYKFRNGKYVGK